MSTCGEQNTSVPTELAAQTRFCLIRHGTTDWNQEARIQGCTNTSLNEQGREEINRLAESIKDEGWELIVTSDLQRAVESGEIIGRTLKIPVFSYKGLRERSFGPLEGLRFEEMKAQYPEGSDQLSLAGLESRTQIEARALATMEVLASVFTTRQVIIVTHGGFLRAFFRVALGLDRKAPTNAERLEVIWNGKWHLGAEGSNNGG